MLLLGCTPAPRLPMPLCASPSDALSCEVSSAAREALPLTAAPGLTAPCHPRPAQGMSLGWCAESGLLPKKRRYINGISSVTMVGLRAQMSKAQQNRNQQHLKTTKGTVGSSINKVIKNKGVEERNSRDAEELRKSTDVQVLRAGTGLRTFCTGGGGGAVSGAVNVTWEVIVSNWPRNLPHEMQGLPRNFPHTSSRYCGLRSGMVHDRYRSQRFR